MGWAGLSWGISEVFSNWNDSLVPRFPRAHWALMSPLSASSF